MPELMRSIVTRLRAFVADRRSAPRLAVRLPCAVRFHDPRRDAREAARRTHIDAYTRDLSLTGLALVVPAIRVGGRYLPDTPLRLLIDHPTGPLELTAQPVRYEQLAPEGEERGFLLGLRITEMADEDRARFESHLAQLAGGGR
jgi:hypothetical protein